MRKNMIHALSVQRGALFGIDARIAVVALAIAATAIGVSSLTRVNEAKTFLAEKRLSDYKNSYLSNMLGDGADGVFLPAVDETFANLASEFGEQNTGVDPWGNDYQMARVSATKTILGQTVTVYYFTVHSYGEDGVNDSDTITNEAAYISWAPENDDIGIKFSTYENTKKGLIQSQEQLNDIMMRLKLYERQIFETVRVFCDNPANQLSTTCDFDGNGVYTLDEEFKMNFLPRSTGEALASKYYSTTTYTSGNETDMTQLLQLIGIDSALVPNYVTDKLARTLHYTSNVTGATQAPFAARVWYQ
jgi:hypothetical protein